MLPPAPPQPPRHVPRTHDNRMAGRQMSCGQPPPSRCSKDVTAHPPRPPAPVLAVRAPSPPAAGSHSQAREDSAPHCRTEFHSIVEYK
jgi:hypothetical protein